MAIALASSIGQQREPVDVTSGLVKGLGDIADSIAADKAANAKLAKEDRENKDNILKSFTFDPSKVKAYQKDVENYSDLGLQIYNDLVASKAVLSPSELDRKKREALIKMDNYKTQIESDYKAGTKLLQEKDKRDITSAEKFLVEQDYFNQPIEKRREILNANNVPSLSDLIEKEVIDYSPGIEKAAKGVFGDAFTFGAFTEKTGKRNKDGTIETIFKDKDAAEHLKAFKGLRGDKKSKDYVNYMKALERAAMKTALDEGLEGNELIVRVDNLVDGAIGYDFERALKSGGMERTKNITESDYIPTSKSTQLNFSSGGGMSGGKLNISDPVLVKSTPEETKPEFIKKVYRNMLDNQIKIQVDGKEAKLGRKLTDSEKDAIVQQVNLAENVGRAKKRAEEMYDNGENLRYYSVQLQGGGKNPAFNFGGQSGTVEGVLVDDGGYVKQVRMKQTGKGGVVQTRDIRLRAEDDFSNYKGNLGNEFDQWLNHNSFKLPFSQKGNKGTVKIVEGYEIPEGAVIKRSKNTGKIVGYELNGKKYQF